MAIDPSLLIAAPILQDYFVDNVTGQAMSGGIITCYQDNSRTTLKNWYYQVGSPGAYTYLPLPNPLTLSDVGTIADANGNDTIPFWYPYDENNSTIKQPYYVTVVDSNLQAQFTRANFPFNPNEAGPEVVVATNKNLIVNNEFWRNIESINVSSLNPLTKSILLNGIAEFYTTLAPSQHDGMPVMSDIQYFKNTNDSTETLTFYNFVSSAGHNFTDQIIPNAITPEYYLNFNCTSSGTETSKYIQIPIQLHVDSLSGVPNCSITIAAMAVTGNPSITLGIYQYLGDGVPSPLVSIVDTIPLTNEWQHYVTLGFNMPSAQGLTLGNGGDDCLYLQIGLPAGGDGVCNLNLAIPGVYLAEVPPTNDFQTYDEINSVISSPRIGDVRTSMNEFYPYGWVPMNDGTIGNSSSNATARKNTDTWPLFNLLWNKFHAYTSGTTNVLAQMVNSSGTNVAYGSSAISDFNLNNAITLTQTMGKVILGTVPVEKLLDQYNVGFTAGNVAGNLQIGCFTFVNFFNGMPIYFTNTGGALPTGLSANTIYYVAGYNSGAATFYVATSFANAMAANQILTGNVIPFTDAGSGTNVVTGAFNATFEGEYAHTQLEGELAIHNHHSPIFTVAGQNAEPGPRPCSTTGNQQSISINIPSDGSSIPFNVTQPGNFFNIYMKL